MFGRSARRASLLALAALLIPTLAYARVQNFLSGTPFGLGLVAGVENRPTSSFATGNQTTTSNYSNYFAAEPFFDLVNVCFRLHLGWHFYPLLNGGGSDGIGSYTESSNAGSLSYGARVMLAPLIGRMADTRFYFVIGVNEAVVKLKNTRKYSSGAQLNQVNTEQAQGSTLELNGGIGYEFFFVQNYSIQLEAGYANRSVDSFNYRTSTDVTGAARSSGDTVKDAAGNPKGFHAWTPYGQLVLNLNL